MDSRGRTLPVQNLTLVELILAFWKHAQLYYRKPDGKQTGEVYCIKLACGPLRELYGGTLAEAFGPQERAELVDPHAAHAGNGQRLHHVGAAPAG